MAEERCGLHAPELRLRVEAVPCRDVSQAQRLSRAVEPATPAAVRLFQCSSARSVKHASPTIRRNGRENSSLAGNVHSIHPTRKTHGRSAATLRSQTHGGPIREQQTANTPYNMLIMLTPEHLETLETLAVADEESLKSLATACSTSDATNGRTKIDMVSQARALALIARARTVGTRTLYAH